MFAAEPKTTATVASRSNSTSRRTRDFFDSLSSINCLHEKSTGEKSRSLTMSAVSSTILSTLLYALMEERHFALEAGLRCSTLGSL